MADSCFSRLLPQASDGEKTARGGKQGMQSRVGRPPAQSPVGIFLGLHKEGRRQGWRRSPLVGFPGVCKESGGGSSSKSSSVFASRERKEMSDGGVCLNWPQLLQGCWIQEQVQASGLLPLAVVESPQSIYTSQISGSDSESAYTPGVPPVCFCHPGFSSRSELLRPAGHTWSGAWAHGVLPEDRQDS